MTAAADSEVRDKARRTIPWTLLALMGAIGLIAAAKAVIGPPRSELPLPPFESIRLGSSMEEHEALAGRPDKTSESNGPADGTVVWTYLSARRRGEPDFLRTQTCRFAAGRLCEKTQIFMASMQLRPNFDRPAFDAVETGADADAVRRTLGTPLIVTEGVEPSTPGTEWTYIGIGTDGASAQLWFKDGRLERKEWNERTDDAPDSRDE